MTTTGLVATFCGGIGLLLAGGAGYLCRSMFLPTRGERISPYSSPRKALVVLDLQERYEAGSVRRPVTLPSDTGMIGRINRLIGMAAETGMEVAYIRQVFGNDLFVRLHGGRRVGNVVIDRRVRMINDHDFEKNRTDAFSSREFERMLIDRQVNELYLVGVDAAFCVYYTARGALNRGYGVTVVTDCVATRGDMSKVLERYRRRGIGTITSEELLVQLSRESPLTTSAA